MYKKLESIWNIYHAVIPCDCVEFAEYMQIITKIRTENVGDAGDSFTWAQRQILHRLIDGICDVIENGVIETQVTADTHLRHCMRIKRALHNSDLAEIGGDLDACVVKLDAIEVKLDVFKVKLDVFKANVDAFGVKLDALRPKLDALKPKLDAVKANVDAVED